MNDCVGSGPLNDQDNYSCEQGICRYQGCQSNLECFSALGPGYQCADVYDSGLDACTKTCDVPADCATAGAANDADNYACENHLCRWTGCNNSVECVTTYGSNYTCGAPAGSSLEYCVPKCQNAADCALDSGSYSADNYACDGGACVWLGCNTDRECEQTYMSSGFSCVEY